MMTSGVVGISGTNDSGIGDIFSLPVDFCNAIVPEFKMGVHFFSPQSKNLLHWHL